MASDLVFQNVGPTVYHIHITFFSIDEKKKLTLYLPVINLYVEIKVKAMNPSGRSVTSRDCDISFHLIALPW